MASSTDKLTPAQIAKAALRRLAEQKREPTPDHYRQAYEQESGLAAPPESPPEPGRDAASATPALSPADDSERWATLISRILRGAERGGRQWTTARKKDSLQRVLTSSKRAGDMLHQRLSQLVASWDSDTLDNSLLEGGQDGSEAAGDAAVPPQAAPASQAVIAPSPATPASTTPDTPGLTLAHEALAELGGLVDTALRPLAPHPAPATTASVTPPNPDMAPPLPPNEREQAAIESAQAMAEALDLATAAPLTADQAEQARQALGSACHQARRVIEHRHHLIAQLTDLCGALTDSLVDLSEDESWVQGQCTAMHHQLAEGLNPMGVRHMQQLLADTRTRQLSLKRERQAARLALKELIHQMLAELAELGQTTDRFQDKLGGYAETIGQADSLESLTGVVREMVAESRLVQNAVAQTQTRLQAEHSRATELTEKVRQLEDEIRQLSSEVSTDPLTQIANRRGMQKAFEAEQARVDRAGTPLAIGLLDVDNFKKLNDQMGHQTGDEALKFLARRVSECLRPVDVVARYGGEEFVVMLPDTVADEAQQVLTRLQRTLSAEFFTHEDKKVFITFSAGVTAYRPGERIEVALERADVALYEAKRTGKNRTCIG
ncbi:diguanylate cyclase [Aquabacterium sp.]|uniref:GGDEF domain-containing protein n=1 Tax=Aquabacterium sp. TaxID=1872578 RepID=UPI0025BC4631|nr:diguanylate cyclase [Aquabacterium sp.]